MYKDLLCRLLDFEMGLPCTLRQLDCLREFPGSTAVFHDRLLGVLYLLTPLIPPYPWNEIYNNDRAAMCAGLEISMIC